MGHILIRQKKELPSKSGVPVRGQRQRESLSYAISMLRVAGHRGFHPLDVLPCLCPQLTSLALCPLFILVSWEETGPLSHVVLHGPHQPSLTHWSWM